MSYKKLRAEAEEMAKGKKTAELAKLGFIYSYISNHEVRILFERVEANTKVLWGLLVTIVVAIALAVVGAIATLCFG